MTSKQSKRGQRQTVQLTKPKKHQGATHPAGAELALYPDQIERARRQGEIKE